jgi:hypothetical protein
MVELAKIVTANLTEGNLGNLHHNSVSISPKKISPKKNQSNKTPLTLKQSPFGDMP